MRKFAALIVLVLALTAARASAPPEYATYLPLVATSGNEWTVRLDDGISPAMLAWPHGATYEHAGMITDELNAWRVTYAGDLRAMAQQADVLYTERVQMVAIPPDEVPDTVIDGNLWHHIKMRVSQAHAIATGAGVTVAVLDTGIAPSFFEPGQILMCQSFTGEPCPGDGNGHGTHVAGSVADAEYGVAPDAQLLAGKVLTSGGNGADSWIANGILWAAEQGADIVNMSLGAQGYSPILCDATERAVEDGVIVVAASGNGSWATPSYPAGCEDAIAVGATDVQDRKAGFSQGFQGKSPAWGFTAPGVSIDSVNGSGWSGTSMASPQVAGTVALYCEHNPACDVVSAVAALSAGAVDLGATGYDVWYGNGRIDTYSTLIDAGPTPTPLPPGTPSPTPGPTSTPAPTATPDFGECRESPAGSGLYWCDVDAWLWPYFDAYLGHLTAISACEDLGGGYYNYCPMRFDRWRFVVEMGGYDVFRAGPDAVNKLEVVVP